MSADHPRLPPPPMPTRDWAMFLDVDGTLLDFASTPEGVHVPAELLDDLRRLHEALGGAVILVSGRLVESLDMLFAPLQLPAIGLHGFQRRDGDIEEHDLPHAFPSVIEAARKLAAKFPGAQVEDKGIAIALHWRSAPAAAEPLREFAGSALTELPGYRLQPGHDVIELRPDGYDKGDAIAALLATPPFADRTPAFVGDDLTDESGFDIVNAHRGITVLVGARVPSAAAFGLRDPPAVRSWLHQAVESLGRNTAS